MGRTSVTINGKEYKNPSKNRIRQYYKELEALGEIINKQLLKDTSPVFKKPSSPKKNAKSNNKIVNPTPFPSKPKTPEIRVVCIKHMLVSPVKYCY